MKNKIENPNGLHRRYYIQKLKQVKNPNYNENSPIKSNRIEFHTERVPVDEGSEYFVLRLDTGGSDINHIKACRIGIHAYADAIEATVPQLAADLRERYPLL